MAAINGRAKLVGVIGDPIGHSLSPALHEHWLQSYGINGAYVALKLTESQFSTTLPVLADAGFYGFNITLPHKEAAYRLADTHDTPAVQCQAVNTLIRTRNHKLHGMNTDVFGFIQMVQAEQQRKGFSLQRTLLLGAGGSARAVSCALHMMGCEHLTIANRTQSRAEVLRDAIGVKAEIITLAEATGQAGEYSCIINTLALNSDQQTYLQDIVMASHRECMIIDISYGHNGTETTRLATEMGRQNCDGLAMLVWQAVPGFEQWFGVTPQVDDQIMAFMRQQAAL